MKRYFGTDGIRGVAGEHPLDAATVFAIGLAIGDDLRQRPQRRVVLGADTRESSEWIAETLAAGLHARGQEVHWAGVLPTPGVAFLARTDEYGAGVMVSASHNPYQDNGIKVFDHSGYKLPDADEAQIEAGIERYRTQAVAPQRIPLHLDPALRSAYLDFLAARIDGAEFGRLKIACDCAHGAASTVAEALWRRLGLAAEIFQNCPDGRNINAHCGALHPEWLAAKLPGLGADAGVAWDGDADRAIFVDAGGAIVNGDSVLLIAARALRAAGLLAHDLVVGTVMANLGLELALRREGITLLRTAVGDKYVLEKMLETGAVLGGEQSGHIIFGNDATTGDGVLTALRLFEIMARTGAPLAELGAGFIAFPQSVINVRVKEKRPLGELDGVQQAIRSAEGELGERGRVLVRYSGTEKLARVMVEAEMESQVDRHAGTIAAALRASIGA